MKNLSYDSINFIKAQLIEIETIKTAGAPVTTIGIDPSHDMKAMQPKKIRSIILIQILKWVTYKLLTKFGSPILGIISEVEFSIL